MLYPPIDEKELAKLYLDKKLSMMTISRQLGCSHHKVAYWMNQYDIKRRTIKEAIYLTHNPNGDPFVIKPPVAAEDYMLYGLGLGLYWGEGTKSDLNAVRLGNTDPGIIRVFMNFLIHFYGVNKSKFRFGLQIFSDVEPEIALNYWVKTLDIDKSQFYRPVVTRSGSIGSYKHKNKYGVVTIRFGNTKLRDKIIKQIADIAQG